MTPIKLDATRLLGFDRETMAGAKIGIDKKPGAKIGLIKSQSAKIGASKVRAV